MMYRRMTIACLVLVTGCVLAPFLPFWLLWVVPAAAIASGAAVPALVVAILLDEFLVPGGFPALTSVTFLTFCLLPAYLFLRYFTKL